jgi:acyl-lipid omega-6 desaturase (Delta-12 desaturase)
LSVLLNNLFIVAVILVADRFIGWRTYLAIQLPVFWFCRGSGRLAVLRPASVSRGGTGRAKAIGSRCARRWRAVPFTKCRLCCDGFPAISVFHNVHHLSPRIPNYHLKKCVDAVPALQAKAPLTLKESWSCTRLKVWDEKQQKMVEFH